MTLRPLNKLLVGLSLLACTSAFATPFTFDVAGTQSYAGFGSAANTVYEINVGANATITSVSYDVNVTAYTPSWLSELGLGFTNAGISEGVLLTPGGGVDMAGTASFSDVIDLVAEGLSFSVDADGILRLEFFEDFNDAPVSPDGIWNFGTFTFYTDGVEVPPPSDVPEPATGLLMGAGLGLMGYTARRRRQRAKLAA